MKKILNLKLPMHSLFFRLFLSFMVVIVLLVSFNFMSFTFFKNNLRENIVTYNNANMNKTVDNYENHFKILKTTIYSIVSDKEIVKPYNTTIINQNYNPNYFGVLKISDLISSTISQNYFLYIQNILLYYGPNHILYGGGITNIESLFSRHYLNSTYNSDFWRQEFEKDHKDYKFYPVGRYSIYEEDLNVKSLLPILFKNNMLTDTYALTFINASQLFGSLHDTADEHFMIYNDAGIPIFSTSMELSFESLPDFTRHEGYFMENNNYYFYKKGSNTGLTYVNIVPDHSISSQITSLNFVLAMLLIVSIVIGVFTSIFFSARLNNPVKRIIESMKNFQSNRPFQSNIKEFDFINENVSKVLEDHHSISKNMEKSKSIIKNYLYWSKLKDIHTNDSDITDLHFSNKPFVFIYINMKFKLPYQQNFDIDQNRAVYFTREFIQQFLTKKYDETYTFQIEKNEILSLVFTEDNEEITDAMIELQKILDLDKEYCFFTIAISSVNDHSSDLTKGYEEVLNMADQRKLNEDSQIINQIIPEKPSFILTQNQHQEFHVHFLSGNTAEIIQWVQKQLSYMKKKNAYAIQYEELANDLINKVKQMMHSLQLDISHLQIYDEKIKHCYTLDDYIEFFTEFLTLSTELIKHKKDEQDHITSFVLDHIEEHYSEDLSLDSVAEKLKITGGYLSTYFKEKTGENFSDYINKIRIDKAKQYLQNSDMKVHEIAEKVGYYNSGSFIRLFKKITGITPGEYRKTIHSKSSE